MYVEMKNIFKQYGSFRASDNVNFGIEKGKLVALLGPSGSGKTTILRMIAGLETPSFGDIYIDGKRVNDIPASKRGIGFVFQNYALFRHMTVYDNIAFGLKLQKVPRDEIRKRVTELLEITGLAGLEKRYPNQLSGGQQQRVSIGRALINHPAILLADEPTGNLDSRSSDEIVELLKLSNQKYNQTIVMITHNLEIAKIADRILRIEDGRLV
jgi:sulfate transport system ATP-binding protein